LWRRIGKEIGRGLDRDRAGFLKLPPHGDPGRFMGSRQTEEKEQP
jgi:hypothetical protein